ncbi:MULTISPECIES: hypothetical protein [unclassified Mycobacterium]|uniref:hypothetical protein n=1 Tax=unclassified Mycobacterium TaxID=2642494 RepID=UPI0007FD30D7|nr:MULTISPECIES: hypothetical protein [unclassified Mycobacterium]OBG99871.1 hypothetical protein A5696_17370 [Mycobacterium sp. E2699]OBI54565.1 hypothetical protein A5705_26270 [Mycobacterium sp. E787]
MTSASPTHELVSTRTYPDFESEISPWTAAAGRTKAIVWRVGTMMPRRRPSEDEIVRAAITVILVALGTIMALAAMAILTMG